MQRPCHISTFHDVYFSDMIEKYIEVFMDDFSVFGSSFDNYLANLSLVLQ